jgi:hypothetical protein
MQSKEVQKPAFLPVRTRVFCFLTSKGVYCNSPSLWVLKYRHEVIDRQLAHVHKSATDAAYDRAQFILVEAK